MGILKSKSLECKLYEEDFVSKVICNLEHPNMKDFLFRFTGRLWKLEAPETTKGILSCVIDTYAQMPMDNLGPFIDELIEMNRKDYKSDVYEFINKIKDNFEHPHMLDFLSRFTDMAWRKIDLRVDSNLFNDYLTDIYMRKSQEDLEKFTNELIEMTAPKTRQPRNGLRPVTIIRLVGDDIKAYFHCFGPGGNMQDGLYITAVVELEDGSISEFDAVNIIFDDVKGGK